MHLLRNKRTQGSHLEGTFFPSEFVGKNEKLYYCTVFSDTAKNMQKM